MIDQCVWLLFNLCIVSSMVWIVAEHPFVFLEQRHRTTTPLPPLILLNLYGPNNIAGFPQRDVVNIASEKDNFIYT